MLMLLLVINPNQIMEIIMATDGDKEEGTTKDVTLEELKKMASNPLVLNALDPEQQKLINDMSGSNENELEQFPPLHRNKLIEARIAFEEKQKSIEAKTSAVEGITEEQRMQANKASAQAKLDEKFAQVEKTNAFDAINHPIIKAAIEGHYKGKANSYEVTMLASTQGQQAQQAIEAEMEHKAEVERKIQEAMGKIANASTEQKKLEEGFSQSKKEIKELANAIRQNATAMQLFTEALVGKDDKLTPAEMSSLGDDQIDKFLLELQQAGGYAEEKQEELMAKAEAKKIELSEIEPTGFVEFAIELSERQAQLDKAQKAIEQQAIEQLSERPKGPEGEFDLAEYITGHAEGKEEELRTFNEQYLGQNRDTFAELGKDEQKVLAQAALEGINSVDIEQLGKANISFSTKVKAKEAAQGLSNLIPPREGVSAQPMGLEEGLQAATEQVKKTSTKKKLGALFGRLGKKPKAKENPITPQGIIT